MNDIVIVCYGKRAKKLRTLYPTSIGVAKTMLDEQFTKASDGYVTVNGRLGFTLNQALRQLPHKGAPA